MSDIVIAVRTHVWNDAVNKVAEEVTNVFHDKRFSVVILVDETNGKLNIPDHFKVVSHTSNFSDFGLPEVPDNRSLWWNADYPMYTLQQAFPQHKFYLMIENDVAVTPGLDDLITSYVDDGVDFIGEGIKKFTGYNGIQKRSTSKWTTHELWRSYIQILGLSNKAITELLRQRNNIKNTIFDGTEDTWPYCEIYIASALIGNPTTTFKYKDLFKSNLNKANFSANIASPISDGRNWLPNSISHPVLGNVDTVKKLINSNSTMLGKSFSSVTKLNVALSYIFSQKNVSENEKKEIVKFILNELSVKSPGKISEFIDMAARESWINF